MKKKAAALALCALLVFQLAAPPAKAAESVYFVAAKEYVLPLSDETMPFWYGGYLYIASTIFTGVVRESLDISHTYNSTQKHVILYSGLRTGGRSLWFELDQNYAYDKDGNTLTPGAVMRNGIPFVPAALVAKFFDLQYSITEVNHGYLVWLRRPGFGLSDKDFANAASLNMADGYNAYLKSKNTQTTPESPETPGNTGTEIEGRSIYLCLEAGDETSAMLDTLDRYSAQAAFFCTVDFLEEQGDLLRRMMVAGQTVGILADAADPSRTVAEQLEAGNRALAQATCSKTRLVMIQNGNEQVLQAARDAGYCCVSPDIDRTGYGLRSASNASSLLKRVSAYQDDVTVWLGDTADTVGLRAFLLAAGNADGRCLALTETV